jgi:hypothetical protein
MPAPVSPGQEAETFATQKAIGVTLQYYIDGARTGNAGMIRNAFVETARISGTYNGQAVEWTVQEFCKIVEESGPASDLKALVVGIEYAGNAAMARLEALNWRGTRYTDFFVLTEQDGVWRIRSKVFFAHSRA